MKVLYKNVRILALLLSFIFLLQSCYVYHQTSISLDEAVAADKKMKVMTIDKKEYKFMKIEKTDSTYYGLLITRGQDVKVPLDTKKIQRIRPVDKGASTVLSIGTVVVPIGIGFLILLLTVGNSL